MPAFFTDCFLTANFFFFAFVTFFAFFAFFAFFIARTSSTAICWHVHEIYQAAFSFAASASLAAGACVERSCMTFPFAATASDR